MNVIPYRRELFTYREIVLWGLLCGGATGLVTSVLMAQLPMGTYQTNLLLLGLLATLWLSVAGFFYAKWRWQRMLHFILVPPGVTVGWTGPLYKVSPTDVIHEVLECVFAMRAIFPNADEALRDTTVCFCAPLTTLEGRQDYVRRAHGSAVIYVCWHQNLAFSTLRQVLAQRIIRQWDGEASDFVVRQLIRQAGL